MATCDSDALLASADASGFRYRNPEDQQAIRLALLCDFLAGGGGGGGTPGGSDQQVQFNDAGAFGGDPGLTFNKTTDLLTVAGSVITPLVGSPAATALQFAAAGTNIANFATTGHLLWNTDSTYDIGGAATNRPRTLNVSTHVNAGGVITGLNLTFNNALTFGPANGFMFGNGDGNWSFNNSAGTGFDRIQFGGTTPSAAFPALQRSAATLRVRLGDDSGFANLSVLNILANNAASIITSSVAMTSGPGAALGTLTDAPSAGNADVWCPILLNGVTYWFPCWSL